ncbi:MAG: hypothetical protein JWN33_436 [Candidatus Saccharibacteria bacterium]|nr:hypothetical protein [Candidatus Saccharibacteria bacterium]
MDDKKNNPPTRTEMLNMMINISAEYVTVVEKTETAKLDQKRDIMRDLSNAGLALLGGVLTLATVGQQFIRTPAAVYTGVSVVALAVITAFFFRIRISRRFTKLIDKQYNDYSTRANAIRGVMSSPQENEQRAQFELDRTIQDYPFSSEPLTRMLSISEIIVSLALFIGTIITAAGLVLSINIS